MDNIEDLPSDSSDDDYDPAKDSDHDEEVSDVDEGQADSDNATVEGETKKADSGSRKNKRKKPQNPEGSVRKRRGGICLDAATPKEETEKEAEGTTRSTDASSAQTDESLVEEEKDKRKADLLWADFMKDAAVKPSPRKVTPAPSPQNLATSLTPNPSKTAEKPSKVEITRVFDFAGEEVRVKAIVDADSKEAKQQTETSTASPAQERLMPAQTSTPSPSQGGSGVGKQLGLSGVLNKLGMKKKMNVLDKSLLDWKDFKNKEGIDEDLKTFNKGKEGYIEKQAFLQRADLRQFEVEKNLRMAKRSNR